jgi:hypothetical protein
LDITDFSAGAPQRRGEVLVKDEIIRRGSSSVSARHFNEVQHHPIMEEISEEEIQSFVGEGRKAD